MDAEQIARGLKKPRKTTGGWEACCPAHDDATPSLSITDGDDGKVLVHCHAGCDQTAVVAALKSDGLWPEKPTNGAAGKPRIVDTYDYVSEDGELIFQVVRFEPKDFRQRQPDGSGWKWTLKGIKRIPYNLPGIQAAKRGIVIVEGEKDANNLIKLGIAATTCAGGAERWQASYNRYFRGQRVYIIPDNDEPGRKHAASIAAQLHGTASEVRVVTLPGLTNKQDVSDWLAAGGTKSELGQLILAADIYEPSPEPPATTPKPAPTSPNDWRAGLIFGNDETLKPCINNAMLLLGYHDDCAGVFGYNRFTKQVDVLRRPPWESEQSEYPRQLNDVDDTRATAWLERLGVKLNIGPVHNAIVSAAHHNAFHPLQEYLNGLKWDGEERLTNAMADYFGCDRNEYTQAVSRKFLIGAVARALQPGCKMDTMLILEGPQGLKKSTAVAELFHDQWFSDELSDIGSKDAAMQLQGIWCVELAELATMYRAESNRLKEWLTRREDRFRPPYGRNVVQAPRQCVLVGTVNPEGGYLKDATGGRRFWPIQCKEIDVSLIQRERDQLWAEAVTAYHAGERWWFELNEAHIAERHQEARYESDPWDEIIQEYIGDRHEATIPGIMKYCLEIDKEKQNQQAQNRIAHVLVSLGFVRRQRRDDDGHRRWVYVR